MNNLRFTTNLKEYLPEWYKPIIDYNQILEAEIPEFETLKAQALQVYANLFFSSMDASTIAQWEKIFSITPSSTETIEFRRARILNRVAMKPPFTIRFLQQRLDEIIGAGQYEITLDPSTYTLIIDTASSDQAYALEVSYTVNHMKPAHILYINRPKLTHNILVNETIQKGAGVWNYVMRSWALGESPFLSMSGGEVIKVAATPSITQTALNALAGDVNSLVRKARLNNSVIITALTKSRTGSTASIEYTVQPSQVSTVTKIELLDSSNSVLTSSACYVPVTQATIFRHSIPVLEGTNGN